VRISLASFIIRELDALPQVGGYKIRAFLEMAIRLVPPVHRLYLQRNRAFAELQHERLNSGLSYHRGAHEDQTRVIQLFRLFSPVAIISAPMIRIGHMADGGYVMADCFTGTRAAFSFGISTEISWDRDIAQRDITVYQYDHSVEAPPLADPHFVFHKKMIGSEQNATCESIASVLQTHGAPRDANILKMDIEGSEWDALDAASSDDLNRFSQIVCEFHGFEKIDDDAWYQRAMRCMTKLRSLFEVVHVHGNNYGHLAMFSNVPFPIVLEVTFITKSGHTFAPNNKTFPTPLDAPNQPGFADIFLGTFQF
jgi:hypothetical protein